MRPPRKKKSIICWRPPIALLPQVKLSKADVDMHYSGVRPLPYVGDATPASVTRRHSLTENPEAPFPFYSIIGGKLTTCRSLAEETPACCSDGWDAR